MTDNYNIYLKQFASNIKRAWKDLYEDKSFCDVTLVCKDKQMMAHKIILCASSSIFQNILKQNVNNHPIIYLNGVQYKDLEYLVKFIYEGELNIEEKDLLNFLELSKDLKIKGLSGENDHNINVNLESPTKQHVNQDVFEHKEKLLENLETTTKVLKNKPVVSPTKLLKEKDAHGKNLKMLLSHENQDEQYKIKGENLDHFETPNENKSTENRLEIFEPALPNENNSCVSDLEKPEMPLPIENNSHMIKNGFPGNKTGTINILNKDPQLTCNVCYKQFAAPYTLRRHKTSAHEGIRYPCEQCSYKATDKWTLKVHTDSIHKRIYLPCDKCEKSYTDRSALYAHKTAVHKGIRYPCDNCEYKAKRKYSLKNHRCIQDDEISSE